jgi:hypothetical protein
MRLVIVLALVACSHAAPPPAKPAAAPTSPADGEIAPQLFTVEQLRAGNPQGRVIELRMEAEGKPTMTEHWEFTAVDAQTATIHAITRDESGAVVADETGTSKWTELHKHAHFPAAATTIQDNVQVTVPAGTFTTRLYTVKAGDATRQFWFAPELPGPPVQFTTEQGGKVVMRAQMLRAR